MPRTVLYNKKFSCILVGLDCPTAHLCRWKTCLYVPEPRIYLIYRHKLFFTDFVKYIKFSWNAVNQMAMPFLEFENHQYSSLCGHFMLIHRWVQASKYFIVSFSLGIPEHFHIESHITFSFILPLYYQN